MTTVSMVRYQRKEKIGDDKSPMVYVLRPKPRESKLYSIESLVRKIGSIGSLLAEDAGHVVRSFVRSMEKVLVIGNEVRVDGLGIFYTTLTCPGVEQKEDYTVKNVTRVNLRLKIDNSLRLANDSTVTTRGGDNNTVFEFISRDAPASGGSGDGGGSGNGGGSGGNSGSGGDGGEKEAPDSTVQSNKYIGIISM